MDGGGYGSGAAGASVARRRLRNNLIRCGGGGMVSALSHGPFLKIIFEIEKFAKENHEKKNVVGSVGRIVDDRGGRNCSRRSNHGNLETE